MALESGYLLDTSVLVALIRNKALGKSIDAGFGLSGALHRSAVSVVTVGEMYSLARQFGWGEDKQNALDSLLDEIVWIDISHEDVLHACGAIDAAGRKAAKPMGENDTWIAATASASGMTLLTTDTDFNHAHPEFLTRVLIQPDGSGA